MKNKLPSQDLVAWNTTGPGHLYGPGPTGPGQLSACMPNSPRSPRSPRSPSDTLADYGFLLGSYCTLVENLKGSYAFGFPGNLQKDIQKELFNAAFHRFLKFYTKMSKDTNPSSDRLNTLVRTVNPYTRSLSYYVSYSYFRYMHGCGEAMYHSIFVKALQGEGQPWQWIEESIIAGMGQSVREGNMRGGVAGRGARYSHT